MRSQFLEKKMKSQLKIILGETIADTKVLVNDAQIEYVESIKINIDIEHNLPDVEIVFPPLGSKLEEQIISNISLLKEFPHVKVLHRAI